MAKKRKRVQRRRLRRRRQTSGDGPRCGLCGKAGKLTKTPCCDNWSSDYFCERCTRLDFPGI